MLDKLSNGGRAGVLTWNYDKANDNFYTEPFRVTIPFPLNKAVTYSI